MRLCCFASLLVFGALSFGLFAQTAPKVKKVGITPTNASSGAEMFASYCASCHGKDGRGNGPAAPALKTPPTNLTQLASKNKGNYPEAQVLASLNSGVTAHGSSDMPVWGEVLKSIDSGDSGLMRMRIYNLSEYVKSIQAK